jgi:hypothetical protein
VRDLVIDDTVVVGTADSVRSAMMWPSAPRIRSMLVTIAFVVKSCALL